MNYELKSFDKVLCRDSRNMKWTIDIYICYDEDSPVCYILFDNGSVCRVNVCNLCRPSDE